MLFERFEVEGLSHYSYAVGCPMDGRIAIVDPERNVERYLRFARQRDVHISHVIETHIHADYASGAKHLARRAGGELWLSAHDEGETYEVGFDHWPVEDGDVLTLGSVRLRAVRTPGHTPEHLSYLVYDDARSSETPHGLLSGDFLFVGSLGRPDLLGEEESRDLAEALFDSVRERLAPLPDGLLVFPAHGAGSLCGSGMGGHPYSTLGYERTANPYLEPELSKGDFVRRILEDAPPFPDYYTRMKALNSAGPEPVDERLRPPLLDVEDMAEKMDAGAEVIDLRDHLGFGGGHLPGAFGLGAGPKLATWAAWVVPYGTPLLLVAEDDEQAEGAVRELVRVGLDRVEGLLDGGIEAWRKSGRRLEEIPQQTPPELWQRLETGEPIQVLDVRSDEEWEEEGRIEGALHVYAGELQDHLDELPRDRTLATICGSGYRSTVASSVLQRHDFDVINVSGGMTAWRRADLPLEPGSRADGN